MVIPDNVAFTLFGKDIYWYGVLMSVGIVLAILLACSEAKRKKMHPDTIIDLALWAIPLGIIGARLYYVAFEFENYASNLIKILYVWEGGLAIYGAIIGGLIGAWIFTKKKKVRFTVIADLVAPGLVLAQAIGRWGNFFNQEAYGPLVVNESHMWFPLSVALANGEIHYATFFYESMWCLLTFLVLWFVIRKRTKHDGDVALWYVMLYSFERMFVEGLRTDSLYIGSIRVSQALSALLFVAVIVFMVIRAVKEKKSGKLMWPAPKPADELSQDENTATDEKDDSEYDEEYICSCECHEHDDNKKAADESDKKSEK